MNLFPFWFSPLLLKWQCIFIYQYIFDRNWLIRSLKRFKRNWRATETRASMWIIAKDRRTRCNSNRWTRFGCSRINSIATWCTSSWSNTRWSKNSASESKSWMVPRKKAVISSMWKRQSPIFEILRASRNSTKHSPNSRNSWTERMPRLNRKLSLSTSKRISPKQSLPTRILRITPRLRTIRITLANNPLQVHLPIKRSHPITEKSNTIHKFSYLILLPKKEFVFTQSQRVSERASK